MVKVEVLCFDELGIADFMKLVKENKNKIHFTYVRLMGDNHEHGHMSTDHRVKVGQEGFMAMMEARGGGTEASLVQFLGQQLGFGLLLGAGIGLGGGWLLHRAKRIARENERFYYWFELLNWEKQLLEEEVKVCVS